jgi:predicted nucleotidyltransferase component of viral defense system
VLEALLARLAASVYRDNFVLKGGALLAGFAVRRPNEDVDLQATGTANDEHDVAERIREIATIDSPDGVFFDADSIAASAIRVSLNLLGLFL